MTFRDSILTLVAPCLSSFTVVDMNNKKKRRPKRKKSKGGSDEEDERVSPAYNVLRRSGPPSGLFEGWSWET